MHGLLLGLLKRRTRRRGQRRVWVGRLDQLFGLCSVVVGKRRGRGMRGQTVRDKERVPILGSRGLERRVCRESAATRRLRWVC